MAESPLVRSDRTERGCRLRWGMAAIVVVLAGCSASVNDALIATPTPYPVRSPVVANNDNNTADHATPTLQVVGGEYDVAIEDLNTAIARTPEQAELYVQRAILWEQVPDFSAAEEDYNRAIAVDPGSAAAYAGRGGVIARTAEGDLVRYQAAMDDFNRALAIDPRYLPGLLGRALVYAERAEFRGDPADLTLAIDEVEQVAEARNELSVVAMRARLLAARGEIDAAEEAIADARSRLPLDASTAERADVEAARMSVALAASDWGMAVEAAEAALRSDPARWEAHRAIATAELGLGDAVAALAAAEGLLAKVPNDGRALYLRGLALAAVGRVEDARISLEAAGAHLLNSPVYQAKVAEALQRL